MLEQILQWYPDEEFLSADGFDDAIIGVDDESMRLIYSINKCINILVDRDKMSIDDAWEYFGFKVKGAYVGEKTPIWCVDDL